MKKTLIAAVLASLCAVASAASYTGMQYNEGDLSVALTQEACPNEAATAILATQARPGTSPKAALVVAGSQAIMACWALDSDNDVYIVDAAGDRGFIPMGRFKPVGVEKDPSKGI
jgi:hypothetical protein